MPRSRRAQRGECFVFCVCAGSYNMHTTANNKESDIKVGGSR